jgi:hypothetical protein
MDATGRAINIRIASRLGWWRTLLMTSVVSLALIVGLALGRATVTGSAAARGLETEITYDRGPQAHMSALHHRICTVP